MFSAIWLLGTVRLITDQGLACLSRGEVRRRSGEARIFGFKRPSVGLLTASTLFAGGSEFR